MTNFLRCTILLLVCTGVLSCVPKPDGNVHLRYSFWGSLEQQKVEERIVAEFQAANPNIKIQTMPIGARYAEKLQSMMVGRVAPDVIMVDMNQYFEWSSRGVLVDLTEDLKELTRDDPLMPIPAFAFERSGHYFAFPINCSGFAMFYNRTALQAAGIQPDQLQTWEDILKLVPKLSKKGGNPNAPTDYAMLMPSPLIVFWAFGGELFDSLTQPTRAIANTPNGVACINFLRKMRATKCVVPPDVSADQGTYQLFRDGKVALYFEGRWRTPNFIGIKAFSWDVLPVPSGPAAKITLHGGTGLAISKDSPSVDAARKFVRYYMSRKGAVIAMTGGRYVPVYRGMAFGPQFLETRPPDNIRVFAETMETGASRAILYAPGAATVTQIFSSRMEEALVSPSIPAEQILKGLDEDLERWLKNQKRRGAL